MLAAASLTDIAEALVQDFELSHPSYRVSLGTGASSTLARQVEHGAPVDVFLSANMEWLAHLQERGYVFTAIRLPVGNTLVVAAQLSVPPLDSLAQLKGFGRIAVADWSHVPAGVYTRQALECEGLWQTLETNLAPTLDVRAALHTVANGAAEAAVVYASDISVVTGVHALITLDAPCAPMIQYGAAVVTNTKQANAAGLLLSHVTDTLFLDLWRSYDFRSQSM